MIDSTENTHIPTPEPGSEPEVPSVVQPAFEPESQSRRRPAPTVRKQRWGTYVVLAILAGGGGLALILMAVLLGTIGRFGGMAMEQPDNIMECIVHSGNNHQRVVVIDVSGIIHSGIGRGVSPVEQLTAQFRKVREDSSVVAVVLNMNTPGGEVTATDEIYHEMMKVKDDGIPVVTCMRSVAASGGYYLASGTDYIIANRMTMTGSIGVIIGGINYAGLFHKIGVKSEVYARGDMKDILDMGREREGEEAEIIDGMVQETYLDFVRLVARGRAGLTEEEILEGKIGRSLIFSGKEALELKLVDELGYLDDAYEKAAELAGVEDPTIIRYSPRPTLGEMLFSFKSKERNPLESLMPEELSIIKKGRLYFLSPIAF